MALIVVGMIVLIIGIVIARNPGAAQRFGGTIKIAGIFIMLIGVLISSIVQIDAGQVGVKKNSLAKYRMMCCKADFT